MFKEVGSGLRSFKILLCLLIMTALTFSSFGLGCSMLPPRSPAAPKENSANKASENSEKPKPPKELAAMLTSLDNITQTLLDQAGMTNNPPEQLSPQNQNQGEKASAGQTGEVSPGNGSQEQNKENNQGTESQDKQSATDSGTDRPENGNGSEAGTGKNQKIADTKTAETKTGQSSRSGTGAAPATPNGSTPPWPLVDQMVQSLHQQWNALEPSIIKAGAKPELIAGFETQLEKLTKAAAGRKALSTLMEDNELYKFITDIEQLFQVPVPPEIHRLRYNLNAILLQIKASDWAAAKLHLHKLQEEWKYGQPRMTEADPALTSRFDYSLTDLEQVISKKDGSLAEIKARICLNNLGELEAKLGQKKTDSTQGQSQNQSENQNQSQGQIASKNQGSR